MEKNKLIWILFGLSAVLVVVSAISFLNSPIGIKEYEVSFTVEQGVVGFNTDTSSLTFGKIPPGGSGVREIVFDNYGEEMIEIEILASKEIIDFLSFQPIYSVPAISNVTIPISVIVPDDAEEKKYFGKIRIQRKR